MLPVMPGVGHTNKIFNFLNFVLGPIKKVHMNVATNSLGGHSLISLQVYTLR